MKYISVFILIIVSVYAGYRIGVHYSGEGIQGALILVQGKSSFTNLSEMEKLKHEIKNNCIESINKRLDWMIDKELRALNFMLSDGVETNLGVYIKNKDDYLYKKIKKYDRSKNMIWEIPACKKIRLLINRKA